MDEDGRRDGDLPCRCHGGVIGCLMMHRRDQYTEEATPEGGSAWRRHGEVHMTIDFLLSALHFLFVFSLVAILAAQGALLRPGMTSPNLRLAAKLDRGYGAGAVLLLAVGFGRVFPGAKGSQFYLSNPFFWTRIFLFAVVAVLSIAPTVLLIRWTRLARLQANFLLQDDQVRRLQRWLRAEGVVLVCIPFLASAMARGFGYL